MNKIPQILNGNDLTLKVPMERHYMNDGSLVKTPISISDVTNTRVIAISENNAEVSVTTREADDGLFVTLGGDATTCGFYGLEITGKYAGRSVRSYIDRYFKLVHEEEEADMSPDQNGIYVMEQPMIIR